MYVHKGIFIAIFPKYNRSYNFLYRLLQGLAMGRFCITMLNVPMDCYNLTVRLPNLKSGVSCGGELRFVLID